MKNLLAFVALMDNYWTRFGFDARLKNAEKAVADVAAFSAFYTLFDSVTKQDSWRKIYKTDFEKETELLLFVCKALAIRMLQPPRLQRQIAPLELPGKAELHL